jgi:hypothetical protein
MSDIQLFDFEGKKVRFVDGKPVANDVAKVLGYADPKKTISTKVDKEYKGFVKMVTPGGIQSVTVLEEAGVYQLIFGSKLENAKEFQKWVFEKVLPSIRKTGSYSLQPKTNTYSHRVSIASKWDIPKGHFCVFHEISLLAHKIGEQYDVGDYDLIDGSVGKCWANYRKDKEWIEPVIKFPIFFGDIRDISRPEANAYSLKELFYFRDWLENEYSQTKLHPYIQKKYLKSLKSSN